MFQAITGCGNHPRCPEGDHYWVSIDGESWLEVNRPVAPEDEPTVKSMFNGDEDGWRYVTYARRWLTMQGARFV